MITKTISVSKPAYEILNQVPRQPNADAAFSFILKDWLGFKERAIQETIAAFERKYSMDFAEFEQACEDGRIADPFSYEVEKDTWDWEAALSEKKTIENFLQWLE